MTSNGARSAFNGGQLPGEAKLSHLFQPGKIGKFTTTNRVKYGSCCVSNYNNRDGSITEREIERCRVIAQTGAGIITNQGSYPDELGEGKAYYRQTAIFHDRFIPQFERIAEMFKSNGAIAIQQILHCGRYGGIDIGYCLQPSTVPQTLPHFRPPREATKEDIKRVIQDYVDASRRALRAGFDGVEITSFMGYLLANFLSPFTNKRTDEYGGSLENRCRFMTELIYAIKAEIGSNPLVVRLNGAELMDRYGGSTEDECLEYMKIAADAGTDMISVTVGWQESPVSSIGRDVQPGYWARVSDRAKKEIPNVPIAFGNRLPDPRMANEYLGEGKFDFWEVCRPMLADPELLHKAREDRLEEKKPCVGCLLCLSRLFRDLPYICTVNAALGHEVEPEYHIKPPAYKKKIVVIGAGPAGLEFAATSAQRGHDVSVYEASDRLGGALAFLADADLANKQDLNDLIGHWEAVLKRLKVPVHLNTPMTAALFKSFDLTVDVAVVATGAEPDLKALPKPSQEGLVTTPGMILLGKASTGQKVVVIGGGKVGLTTAEHLASQGHEVTIIEATKRIAEDVMPTWKWRHTSWVEELKIKVLTKSRVKAIGDGGVTVVNDAGEETFVAADTVVASDPLKPRQELLHALEYMVDEVFIIGNAVSPRGIYNSIHDGYRLGCRV